MQRNVLPQHKIACFFVSMSNGSTKVEFKLYMRVAYRLFAVIRHFYCFSIINSLLITSLIE